MLAEQELRDFCPVGNYRALTLAIASPVNKLCFTGFNHSTAGEVRQYLIQGLTMEDIAFKFAISVEQLEQYMEAYPIDYQKRLHITWQEALQIAQCKKDEGLSYRELAYKFGYKRNTIVTNLQKYGLYKMEGIPKFRNTLTLAEAQEAHSKHRAGERYSDLAREYNCGRDSFKALMKGHGMYEGQTKPIRVTLAAAQEAMRLRADGQTFDAQAKAMGMGRTTLINALVEYGLYVREAR